MEWNESNHNSQNRLWKPDIKRIKYLRRVGLVILIPGLIILLSGLIFLKGTRDAPDVYLTVELRYQSYMFEKARDEGKDYKMKTIDEIVEYVEKKVLRDVYVAGILILSGAFVIALGLAMFAYNSFHLKKFNNPSNARVIAQNAE